MGDNNWEALKRYINIHRDQGQKAVNEIEDFRLKQQLQVKVATFEEVLKVMQQFEDDSEED